MENNTTPAPDHAVTVAQMVTDGTTQITINDSNEQAWESGLASYLMENYHYVNLRSSFIAYINKPK